MIPRLLLPLMLIFLAACGAGSAADTLPTPTPRPVQPALERPTYTAQRGTVVDEIRVNGFVAALRQQELSFTQSGFLKVLYVDRTSVVTEGQLLAELDLGDLPNQLRQAEVSLEQSQNALNRVREQRTLATRRAELDLADAQAQLSRLTAPPLPEERAAVEQAIERARADLAETRNSASAAKSQAEVRLKQATDALPLIQVNYTTARIEWDEVKDHPGDRRWQSRYEAFLAAERTLRQAESDIASARIAYDTARANEGPAIERAEAALLEAQSRLTALLRGPTAIERATAQRAVERAQIALEEARQSEGDTELEARVAAASLEYERLQTQIEAGKLYAPFDGVVSAIASRPGTAVEAYRAVITVIDDSEKELLVESIPTQDAGRIGIGQPVRITFSRAPGQSFDGVVVALPTAATSSAATINPDRAYHIEYEAPGVPVDVGDLAQVVITLKRVDDAIWLPPQAVRSFEGRRFVVIQDGDRQRRQDVRVGIISTERIEILEGLNEGDIIVGQ
ncbi:MAG TPA: HlyD family efflux transporter periplasmic adaptor subunit [Roseiflexaceae bacterium]|nr:HlyD family efflux transporter periplasmic adaptor subunit [Roseiflexaceae bacterium]